MRNIFVGLIGVVSLCLSACGGSSSSSGGSCGNGSACGGDVVGTWGVTSSCLSADASSMMGTASCPGSTESTSGLKIAGTITYNADMSYSSNLTTSGNLVVTLPASCLTQQGVTVTCSQIQQVLSSDTSGTFTSATCADSGGGCACTLAIPSSTTTTGGTYSTAGGVLTQTDTGGTPDDSNYCVKDGTLSISPAAGSSAMQSGVSGVIVLAKQ